MQDEKVPFPSMPFAEFKSETQDTQFLPEDTIKVVPDPDCKKCHGRGRLLIPEDTNSLIKRISYMDCDCILKKQTLKYLTPRYMNAVYSETQDVKAYLGKNILFYDNYNKFKSIVKTFLLKTDRQLSHYTAEPQIIFNKYFEENKAGMEQYHKYDLLIIPFIRDPHNKIYGELIASIIMKRGELNRPTWLFSAHSLKSEVFWGMYRQNFAQFLEKMCEEKNLHFFHLLNSENGTPAPTVVKTTPLIIEMTEEERLKIQKETRKRIEERKRVAEAKKTQVLEPDSEEEPKKKPGKKVYLGHTRTDRIPENED
jgi:hypothetical protein